VKWVHVLREDPINEAILETRKKFQEQEGMDFNEAVEAAVNQRKYLLNRVFQPLEEPDTDEEDIDEEDTDESPDESPDKNESREEDRDDSESLENGYEADNEGKQFSQGQMGYIPRPNSVFVGEY